MKKSDDNGLSLGGAKGGTAHPKPIRVSAHLAYLKRLVARGSATADDVAKAMEFASNLLDSPEASERDKNNASKTIATIAKMTADVALALHKDDRLDSGHDTERGTIFHVTVPGSHDADD